MKNAQRQISKGIAITHDVSIEVKFKTEFIETFNSKRPTDAVIKIGEKIGLNVIPNRKPMSFSEDFAHFLATVSGDVFSLGNGEKEPFSKLYSSYYNFNDDLIEIGRKFWVALVEDRLPKL